MDKKFEQKAVRKDDPRLMSRCTQIADFHLVGHFTAVKSRTTMASLHLNRGQTANTADSNYDRVMVSYRRTFAPKSRTKFSRKFVRGLSTRIRDLSAVVMYLNHGQALKTLGCQSAI
jgi:hypothetical protein